jgi:hypothetical protein
MNNVIKQHAKEARSKIVATSVPVKKNNKKIWIYSVGAVLALSGVIGTYNRISNLSQEFHSKEVLRIMEEKEDIFQRECRIPENDHVEKLNRYVKEFNTNIFELEEIYKRDQVTNPLYKIAREIIREEYAHPIQCKAGVDQMMNVKEGEPTEYIKSHFFG